MARPQSSRKQLEEALQALRAEGVRPTVRALRERVGRGSFSTIVAVLRSNSSSQSLYAPVHKAQDDSRREAPAPAPTPIVRAPTTDSDVSLAQQQTSLEALGQVLESLEALRTEVQKLRESHAHELQLAYERFESVQKYSLMEVHAAREQTQAVQRALRDAQAGVRTREDVLLNQASQLRERVAFLKGKVAALGGNPDG